MAIESISDLSALELTHESSSRGQERTERMHEVNALFASAVSHQEYVKKKIEELIPAKPNIKESVEAPMPNFFG